MGSNAMMMAALMAGGIEKELFELTFDSNGFPVSNPNDVAEWNTVISTPFGYTDTPFKSVVIDGMTAKFEMSSIPYDWVYNLRGDNTGKYLINIENSHKMFDNYVPIYGAAFFFQYNKLSSQKIDELTIAMVNSGLNDGTLSAEYQTPTVTPSSLALANKVILESRGWTVNI